MPDLDPEVVETTQALLDVVQRVLGKDSDLMPTSAVLIYKAINREGESRSDYVITHDLNQLDVIGLTTVVCDDARDWFREQRDESGWT